MLAIIVALLIMLWATINIILAINKKEIWGTIKFKEEDEDDKDCD